MKNLTLVLALLIPSISFALPASYRCEVNDAASNDPKVTQKLLDRYDGERMIVKVLSGQVISNNNHSGHSPLDLPRALNVMTSGYDGDAWTGGNGTSYLQINAYVDTLLVPFTFVIEADKEVSGTCLRSYI